MSQEFADPPLGYRREPSWAERTYAEKRRPRHSPFPWKITKAKDGIDGADHLIAILPNGSDDMTLYITSSKPGDDPLYDAKLIARAVSAFAALEEPKP